MVRADDLVPAGVLLEAAQPIVFDVVDTLQKQKGDDPDGQGEGESLHAEQGEDCEEVGRLDEVVPQHVILHGEKGLALALEQLHLQLPGAHILPGDGGEPEPIDRLVEPRRGPVLRRGDTEVMAVVVLDEEVHVQARHVQQLAHQPLCQRLPVAQFVRHVDAVRGEQDAAGQSQADHLISLEAAHLDGVQRKGQQAEYDGHVEVEHRIEDPLGLLAGDVIFLEVLGRLPSDHVEHGNHEKRIEHGRVGPDALSRERQIDRDGHGIGEEVFEILHNQWFINLGEYPITPKVVEFG